MLSFKKKKEEETIIFPSIIYLCHFFNAGHEQKIIFKNIRPLYYILAAELFVYCSASRPGLQEMSRISNFDSRLTPTVD